MKLTSLFIVLILIACNFKSQAYSVANSYIITSSQKATKWGTYSNASNVFRYNNWKQMTRKERRLNIGEDILEVGLHTMELADVGYGFPILIAIPMFTVGGGVMLWGALTPTFSKHRKYKKPKTKRRKNWSY